MSQNLTSFSEEIGCPNLGFCDYLSKELAKGTMIPEQTAMHSQNICAHPERHRGCFELYGRNN